MDYLTQAKTFLHRASDTNDVEERITGALALNEQCFGAVPARRGRVGPPPG
jgi:hypothetical protein